MVTEISVTEMVAPCIERHLLLAKGTEAAIGMQRSLQAFHYTRQIGATFLPAEQQVVLSRVYSAIGNIRMKSQVSLWIEILLETPTVASCQPVPTQD
jgi:hypothetical protein